MTKSLFGQVTVFPLYLSAFFPTMALLEGHSPQHAVERAVAQVPSAFVGGCVFWPVANLVNFLYVPAGVARVRYVGVLSVLWGAVLSWLNALDTKHALTAEDEAVAWEQRHRATKPSS